MSIQLYVYIIYNIILNTITHTHITRTLINALILSRIDYCGSLFSCINSTDIKSREDYSRFYTTYL